MSVSVIDIIEGCDLYYVVVEQQPVSKLATAVTMTKPVIKTITPWDIEVGKDSVKFKNGGEDMELPIVNGYLLHYHASYHRAMAEIASAKSQKPVPQVQKTKSRVPQRRLTDLAGS